MQLYPTRSAADLAAVGIALVGVGVVAMQPAIVAWGGSLLVGLAIARGVTLLGVARVRAAGFEMLWREETRLRRVGRGQVLELSAEVRNRDSLAATYVELRAVASPHLDIHITPSSGEVPAGGRLRVTVRIRALRVGRHGMHGLSLEVRGSPGLFEIPLTFPNPFGVEVMPAAYSIALRPARGGRSRALAETGRPGPLSGDGMELREIRELSPGDSFKRIAWKASARRGKLMVRDYEREERDVVWLLLDASVELWAGPSGFAPLDIAIDQVAAVAHAHLVRGDRVGLAICASRPLALLSPQKGPAHAAALMAALAVSTGTLDADRSDLDEQDVAYRVLEHLRPHDPRAAAGLRLSEPERIARRAERTMSGAPFQPIEVLGRTATDRVLRRYLSSYGIGTPARLEPDRSRTDVVLAAILGRVLRDRPRPSLVFLWSPAPSPKTRPVLSDALHSRPKRGVELRWVPMHYEQSLPRDGIVANAVADAVAIRTRLAESHGERELRRMGVRVEKLNPRTLPLRDETRNEERDARP